MATPIAQRHQVVPAVYVLLRRGETVLLLRRAHTGYCDGLFSLPAGHVDGNEPAITAAIREVKEETGVDVTTQDLRLVHVMHRYADTPTAHERVDLFFEATTWRGEPVNAEPNKCDALEWHPLHALPGAMVPEVGHVLGAIAQGDLYSDYNFPLTA